MPSDGDNSGINPINNAGNNTVHNAASNLDVTAVSIKLPAFITSHPELWFAQVESQFLVRNITSEDTKYWHVTAALSPEVAMEVWDIISKPPLADKYSALKSAIIDRLAASEKNKMQQLLSQTVLGDEKPSKLLRRMQALVNNKQFDEGMFRQLFLQRLPQNVQIALAALPSSTPLDNIASVSDHVCELQSFSPASQVYAANIANPTPPPDSQAILSAISALTTQVAALTTQLTEHKSRQRSRTPHQRRQRSSSRKTVNKDHCWYHNRFGANAEKCLPPCNYKSGNDASGH